MAASQVVLYFDKQEDALLFTLAASSVIAAEEPAGRNQALAKIAEEIRKASRITTEKVLYSSTIAHREPATLTENCA
ncbi:MAG: hypothetical protein JWO91_514 [Acidobacteriaceae bacterium]|nr:hypothetical protein [Acidobacteriaceae bacterium]